MRQTNFLSHPGVSNYKFIQIFNIKGKRDIKLFFNLLLIDYSINNLCHFYGSIGFLLSLSMAELGFSETRNGMMLVIVEKSNWVSKVR